jgi:hypothetical protein
MRPTGTTGWSAASRKRKHPASTVTMIVICVMANPVPTHTRGGALRSRRVRPLR